MGVEFFVTSLLIILIPGTGVIYTLAAGLSGGQRRAIIAAFGCTLGIVPHLTASILGLAALLHASATLFAFIKYLGVAYLLYLAWQTLKSAGPLALSSREETPKRALSIVRNGILLNVLNPKLSIFFVAFLPQFITPGEASPTGELLVLSLLFMAMTFVVFVLYGVFAAAMRAKVLQNARLMRWLQRTVAIAFAGFGLRLAFTSR
ncbi:LysE family translocator [Afifella marina]|uniref:Threonine/homoserine/homoserine lactone efflux protein n=1 Tax=Afifella marina DSM 2698 TaxID=1120955 RepID=A0A1G5NNY3_AFIMA|nr:LysE family translocator [Afifella marina]MBK1624639.1 LysE family translocator [Afifella marina DSM 2698]MBK1627532.1 LysE family translocator [Afifella marina]MBK5918590.1 lysine transporter LysE [Afifella marina]RAI18510.1 lysine transporter LysE [Afifella marina DSM 2698]SCZ38638.1 Threonine/homoserine/homoserine lactone efflux protein [Afifella marina DSM 2698]